MSATTKIQAKAITIKAGEFRHDYDLSGRTFAGFAEADRALRLVASRMRKDDRGYCKIWFVISWDNGDSYEGRVDLTPDMNRQPTIIREHVTGFLGRTAGRVALPGMTLEASIERLAHWPGLESEEARAEQGAYLDAHDFGPVFS